MSYNIFFASSFNRCVRKYRRRFPHIKDDMRAAIKALLEMPRLAPVIPRDYGARKLRVRNSDLTKGKSSGYRLIYYVEEQPKPTIYLLFLYCKLDKSDITSKELKQWMDELLSE